MKKKNSIPALPSRILQGITLVDAKYLLPWIKEQGGGGEPDAYIKDAQLLSNDYGNEYVELTKKDDDTVDFNVLNGIFYETARSIRFWDANRNSIEHLTLEEYYNQLSQAYADETKLSKYRLPTMSFLEWYVVTNITNSKINNVSLAINGSKSSYDLHIPIESTAGSTLVDTGSTNIRIGEDNSALSNNVTLTVEDNPDSDFDTEKEVNIRGLSSLKNGNPSIATPLNVKIPSLNLIDNIFSSDNSINIEEMASTGLMGKKRVNITAPSPFKIFEGTTSYTSLNSSRTTTVENAGNWKRIEIGNMFIIFAAVQIPVVAGNSVISGWNNTFTGTIDIGITNKTNYSFIKTSLSDYVANVIPSDYGGQNQIQIPLNGNPNKTLGIAGWQAPVAWTTWNETMLLFFTIAGTIA